MAACHFCLYTCGDGGDGCGDVVGSPLNDGMFSRLNKG